MSSEPTKDHSPKRGLPCPCGSGQLFELCCEPILTVKWTPIVGQRIG